MSFVGNCGTFTRGYKAMIMDVEFLYHLLYLLICALGLFVHEFFYSLLVGIHFVFRMFFFLCACKVPPRCHPLLAFCFTTGRCRAGTLLKMGLWCDMARAQPAWAVLVPCHRPRGVRNEKTFKWKIFFPTLAWVKILLTVSVLQKILVVHVKNSLWFCLLSPAVWLGVPRGDLAECHQKCHSQWAFHHPDGCSCAHLGVPLLYRGVPVLQRWLHPGSRQAPERNVIARLVAVAHFDCWRK